MGQNNDTRPEFLRDLMPVRDFRVGDVVEGTEVLDVGFRVTHSLILQVMPEPKVETLWPMRVLDVDTHEVMTQRFSTNVWHHVHRGGP